jgi:hypothetical protein
MTEYRSRPKGDFIMHASWEELYVLTQHWKSDIEFYKDDLRFLHNLIDKYIIWITQVDHLNLVKTIKLNLFDLKRSCELLSEKITDHLGHLGTMIEDPENKSRDIFKEDHQQLEDEVANFVKRFRANRKEVFAITEYVIDSEQLSNIFNS